jgi:hypothetical protein
MGDVMSRFTADEAFDFRGTEDAIIIDNAAAAKICRDHSTTLNAFIDDEGDKEGRIDAGDLLAWLGY